MRGIVIAFLVVLFPLLDSLYIVDEREQALVLQFGELVDIYQTPGLKLHIPYIQRVQSFSRQRLHMAVDDKEVIAKDQKRLIVSAFATYHITDPLVFFQTVRNEEGARTRLAAILDSSLRQILGEVMLTDLLGEQRQKAMRDIRRVMREQARSFGVTVADVRIMRADLPEENSRATYERMISDRRQQAERYRAEGEEEAVKITADADKQYQLILADAVRREQLILGEADAEAASIFSKVAQKDPEFFGFFRTLETYRRVFKKEDTTLMLSSDNPFLETLTKGK